MYICIYIILYIYIYTYIHNTSISLSIYVFGQVVDNYIHIQLINIILILLIIDI